MNKRKRVAALKHRRRHKKYDVLRKAALLAGTAPVQQTRRMARPKLISAPLQEAVVTPEKRTRRAPAKKPIAAEATPPTKAAVEAPAPARRTRRAPVREPAIVETTPAADAVVVAPTKRTRRAPVKKPTVAEAIPPTKAAVEAPAPVKRSKRSTTKQTDEATEQPSTPAKGTRRKTSAKGSASNDTKTAADDLSGSSSS